MYVHLLFLVVGSRRRKLQTQTPGRKECGPQGLKCRLAESPYRKRGSLFQYWCIGMRLERLAATTCVVNACLHRLTLRVTRTNHIHKNACCMGGDPANPQKTPTPDLQTTKAQIQLGDLN